MQAADITCRPLQPRSLALFRGEEFTVNRIVHHARHHFPILIRSLSNHLPEKNDLRADVIGDRSDICRLERKRNCRNRLPARGW